MGYIKQLDVIRAFAIFCVVITHWSSQNSIFYIISTTISAPFIFFTISGFLITRILISERIKAESINNNKILVFKNFFIRRALRIFPAYYFTIFLVYFFNNENINNYYSNLTYTTNFHQNISQTWGIFPHFWTMAVEEQFYLFWPFIILFIPKKLLLPNILLFIFLGITSRFILPNNEFALTLPYTCFDALGLGALLSWFLTFKPHLMEKVYKVLTPLAFISIALIIIEKCNVSNLYLFHRTFISILTTWLLSFFISQNRNFTNKYAAKLNNLLMVIGKMSYGIFLYHIPLINHSYKVLAALNTSLSLPQVIKNSRSFFLLENFIILIIISWISWRFFELPISNLKKYFKNKKEEVSPNKKSLINVA